MNSSKDIPVDEFNKVIEQWISRSANGNPQMGLVCLESHYRVDLVLEFDNLKDIVDGYLRNVDFLNNKLGRTFVVFLTMNSLREDPYIYYLIDWKNVLLSLLSMKVAFKAIVCICDQQSFNNLVITLQEGDFEEEIFIEYIFYQTYEKEVPLVRSSSLWMNLPLLIYAYLFPSQEGKSTQVEILVSRHFLAWVPACDCSFLEN